VCVCARACVCVCGKDRVLIHISISGWREAFMSQEPSYFRHMQHHKQIKTVTMYTFMPMYALSIMYYYNKSHIILENSSELKYFAIQKREIIFQSFYFNISCLVQCVTCHFFIITCKMYKPFLKNSFIKQFYCNITAFIPIFNNLKNIACSFKAQNSLIFFKINFKKMYNLSI